MSSADRKPVNRANQRTARALSTQENIPYRQALDIVQRALDPASGHVFPSLVRYIDSRSTESGSALRSLFGLGSGPEVSTALLTATGYATHEPAPDVWSLTDAGRRFAEKTVDPPSQDASFVPREGVPFSELVEDQDQLDDEPLFQAIRDFERSLGGKRPTVPALLAYRSSGQPGSGSIPALTTLYRKFHSFNGALRAAGITRWGHTFTERQAIDSLAIWIDVLKRTPTSRRDYDAHRLEAQELAFGSTHLVVLNRGRDMDALGSFESVCLLTQGVDVEAAKKKLRADHGLPRAAGKAGFFWRR